MLEEQYKRAFNSIVPSPQLVGRTERSIEDMMNGKNVRKITLRPPWRWPSSWRC